MAAVAPARLCTARHSSQSSPGISTTPTYAPVDVLTLKPSVESVGCDSAGTNWGPARAHLELGNHGHLVASWGEETQNVEMVDSKI